MGSGSKSKDLEVKGGGESTVKKSIGPYNHGPYGVKDRDVGDW